MSLDHTVYIGTFVKVKIKKTDEYKQKYGCLNHKDQYFCELDKFCKTCGSPLQNFNLDEKIEKIPDWYSLINRDEIIFVGCNQLNEHLSYSNSGIGELVLNDMDTSFVNVDVDMAGKIEAFKVHHSKYLEWLDKEGFDYIIDFGVIQYYH